MIDEGGAAVVFPVGCIYLVRAANDGSNFPWNVAVMDYAGRHFFQQRTSYIFLSYVMALVDPVDRCENFAGDGRRIRRTAASSHS